jgi:hypothetical protein
MKINIAVLLIGFVAAQDHFPTAYSYQSPSSFKQCDSPWGSDHYGIENVGYKTICDSGDKLTALAMILDGCKIKIDGE